MVDVIHSETVTSDHGADNSVVTHELVDGLSRNKYCNVFSFIKD